MSIMSPHARHLFVKGFEVGAEVTLTPRRRRLMLRAFDLFLTSVESILAEQKRVRPRRRRSAGSGGEQPPVGGRK